MPILYNNHKNKNFQLLMCVREIARGGSKRIEDLVALIQTHEPNYNPGNVSEWVDKQLQKELLELPSFFKDKESSLFEAAIQSNGPLLEFLLNAAPQNTVIQHFLSNFKYATDTLGEPLLGSFFSALNHYLYVISHTNGSCRWEGGCQNIVPVIIKYLNRVEKWDEVHDGLGRFPLPFLNEDFKTINCVRVKYSLISSSVISFCETLHLDDVFFLTQKASQAPSWYNSDDWLFEIFKNQIIKSTKTSIELKAILEKTSENVRSWMLQLDQDGSLLVRF